MAGEIYNLTLATPDFFPKCRGFKPQSLQPPGTSPTLHNLAWTEIETPT